MNAILECRLSLGLTRKQAAERLGIPDKLMFALELGADAVVCPGRHIFADKVPDLLRKPSASAGEKGEGK